MKSTLSIVSGAIVGAGLMYIADPQQGARRRAIGSDRMKRVVSQRAFALRGLARHLLNRAQGALTARQLGHADLADQTLVARIRSKAGHIVSHPHQLEITASDGQVVLAGHLLESELIPLLTMVEAVAGVLRVKNTLTVHRSPKDILTLQPRTPETNHRGALLAAATLGGFAVGVVLASVQWRRLGAGTLVDSISHASSNKREPTRSR